MGVNDNFLKEYKSLEETCRDINIDLKDLAEELGDVDGNKLNICRQMRNYLSHNSEKNFLVASNAQIKFLSTLNKKMKERDDICSKHLRKKLDSFSCSLVEKCSDVIMRMSASKSEYFLVIGAAKNQEVILGVVSIFDLAVGLANSKTTRIKDIPLDKKVTINYVSKNTKFEDAPTDGIVICTDAGEPDSKILGVLVR